METTMYPKYRWFVLATLCIATACTTMVMISAAPLIGAIAGSLNLTLGQTTGLTMGTIHLAGALSAIFGGFLVDRFGPFRVWLAGLALIIVSSLLLPVFAGSVLGVGVMRFLQGCGGGPIAVSAAVIAAEWFPAKDRGIVTGVQGSFVTVGIAVGFVVVPLAFHRWGDWRIALASVVPLCVIAGALTIALMLGPSAPQSRPAAGAKQPGVPTSHYFKTALRQPVTWVGVGCYFLLIWIMASFNDLAPNYLAMAPPVGVGLGPLLAGNLMLALQIGHMVGAPLGGVITDKLFAGRARPVVMIGFIFCALFCASVQFPSTYARGSTLLTVLCLVGFFQALVIPQLLGFIAKSYPRPIVGKVGGMTIGIGIFGGTAGVALCSFALHLTKFYLMSINIVAIAGVIGLIVALGLLPPKVFAREVG